MELDLIGQDLPNLREVNWDTAAKCDSINFHFNRLTNLRGLPPLANILELNLSSNHFKTCDLPELSALYNLITLDLSGNKIASLRHLPHIPTLRNLSVAFNFITSVEYIQVAVPYLEQLDVRGNQIAKSSDLDPLSELSHLRVLFIGGPQQNPVCSRIPNMTRLFQICGSLQLIDDKTMSEWRNIQLLDAPTPKFDELLKVRSGGSSSSKKQKQQLLSQHTPFSSNVLFPNSSEKSRRSSRFFEQYNDSSDGYYEPHETHRRPSFVSDDFHHPYHHTSSQASRNLSYDDFEGHQNEASGYSGTALRRPSNSMASGSGIRTNPWSTSSNSGSEAYPDIGVQTDATPFRQTIVTNANNSLEATSQASPTFSTKSSPRKGSLSIQVEDEASHQPETGASVPYRSAKVFSAQSDGDRTNVSSPSKISTVNDADFRKEEHQLSLRLVSTLMTLTALNEKQAFAQKMHAFNMLKSLYLEKKHQSILQQKDQEIDQLRVEILRETQERHSEKLSFEQRLQEELSKFHDIRFQNQQQELQLQDLRRNLERLQADKEAADAEKDTYYQETKELKQLLEDSNLRLIQLQTKGVHHHSEMHSKEEELRSFQEKLKQQEDHIRTCEQEMEYCQHRIRIQEESTNNYKASIQVLQDTINAKGEALVLKEHELEVLKQKLHQFEDSHVQTIGEREQSLQSLRQEVKQLSEANNALTKQVEEFESRRLESRLMTLQTAFDEITQHNLELQKEVLDKNVQHQNDRKVMKELSKCIKKLQDIDAYRTLIPCEKCQSLQNTLAERDGQLDRMRHDFVQLQHDYQQLRLHDDTTTEHRHQQQVNMEAQKQLMMDQLTKLEATMREIDVSKHDVEMQLQVKDVMLHDQRLQIEDLRHRISDFETAESVWQDLREDLEGRLEDYRHEIEVLEQNLEVKSQIAQKVKRIIRDYLQQELKHQQLRQQLSGSKHDASDSDNDSDTEGRVNHWDPKQLTRSIELLSVNELKSTSQVDEDTQYPPEEMSDKERERQWAMKRLRNAVQHAQGFANSKGASSSKAMDDAEFLSLLEDIDGVALSKFHKEETTSETTRNAAGSAGKPPLHKSPKHSRYDKDEYREDESEELEFDEEKNEHKSRDNSRSKKVKHSDECVNMRCQQEKRALEQSLQDAYRKLTQQKVEFEVKLLKKNEEYERVSESLVMNLDYFENVEKYLMLRCWYYYSSSSFLLL